MTVLDHARKLVADCDEELHFERRVKRALKCLIAEIERLESELESIGAGGVGPLMPTAVQHQNEFNADNDLATKTSHSVTSGSTVPTGWKLVPVMPTSEMGASAVKYANGDDIYEKCTTTVLDIEAGIYEEIYRAMLAAAPKPPTTEQSSVVEQLQGERHPGVLMPSRSLVDQVIRELARYCNTGEMDDAESLLASLQFSIDPAQQPSQDEPAPLELKT